MSPLRLFYILDSLAENDVGDQVATLLESLPRAQFEARVVGLGVDGALGSRVRQLSVAVHRLGLSGFGGSLLAIPRVRSLLRTLRADVVHTFHPWAGVVAQVAAPRGTRVVRSVGGIPPEPQTMEQRMHAWLERRATRLPDRHFAVADALAVDAVRQRYGIDEVRVVPECLDRAAVRTTTAGVRATEAALRMGLAEGQCAIVVASDFLDRGAPLQILEAFTMARAERPELRMFFLGAGPEEGAARWHAEELRLEDSVLFLGAVTHDRPALLRVCRGAVDASSWPGWSRVALEAMACGLPVLRWVEDDDDLGQARYPVCTAGPSSRIAHDLLHLLDDGTERARVVKLCEEEGQRHDVAAVVDLWKDLYSP